MKILKIYIAKDIRKEKKQPIEWKNIFANHVCDEGLVYKNVKNS